MSTRSVVARPTGGEAWRGRYVHSDGAPTSMVPRLRTLFGNFDRDYERMMTHLLEEHSHWSYIGGDPSYPTDFVEYRDRPQSEQFLDADGECDIDAFREALRPFTDRNMCLCHRADDDEPLDRDDYYVNTDDLDGTWTPEWAYVLTEAGMSVWRSTDRTMIGGAGPWLLVRFVRWDDEAVDLGVIECGAQYEYCNHYAWFHDESAKVFPFDRLNMRQWMGHEPIGEDFEDARQVRVNGLRVWNLTGSGGRRRTNTYPGYGPQWDASVVDPDDENNRSELCIALVYKKGVRIPKGIELIYPKPPHLESA